jgi:FtsX-like permease family protein/MacB-like protein
LNFAVGAAWLRIRAESRSTWQMMLVITLLLALGGGVALTALAGARRTQTAMHRFLAYNQPEDVVLFFNTPLDVRARVLALPQVASYARLPYLFMSSSRSTLAGSGGVFGATDPTALRTIERPMILHGRRAQQDRAQDAMVNEAVARSDHLRVGSRLVLYSYTLQQALAAGDSGFFSHFRPEGPRFVVRVVGIAREPTDISIVPNTQHVAYDSSGTVYVTTAFVREFARALGTPVDVLPGNEIVRVRLRHGAADVRAFTRRASAIAGDGMQLSSGSSIGDAAAAVQRGIDVGAIALLIFAGLAALATVLLVALNISRMLRAESRDHAKLAALGMSRGRLIAVDMARPVMIALAGAALAVVVAVLASPLTPIGVARQAELHPGVAANIAILGVGFLVLLIVTVACASVAALRTSAAALSGPSTARLPVRRAHAGEALTRVGVGPSARLGIGSAWGADGVRTASRRGAMIAVAVAVAGVVAAFTFGASLDQLARSPRQQGWDFDVVVGNPNAQSDQEARAIPLLERNRDVAAYAGLAVTPETPTVDGHPVGLVGIDMRHHVMGPVILDGRLPRAPDEVVLARGTLRQLHRRVGDRVEMAAGPHRVSMLITGAVLNTSAGDVFTGRLDEGGAVTLTGLRRIQPDAFISLFVVRYAKGVDPSAALARLQHDFGQVVLQRLPARDVENLVRVDSLPRALAALLAVLALVTLVHVLLASVRRRRHDLAILKAVGFARQQLGACVLWQTWALAVAGLVVGIPLGILVGRWSWRLVASGIGSVQPPTVPALALALVVPGVVLLVTLAGIVPAWLAAHVEPATALRRE